MTGEPLRMNTGVMPAPGAQAFAAKVRDLRLPPLPVAVTRLIVEVNRPDPDMERMVEVIAACPETAVKVIQTVNSSIFSLRHPVISVRHAAALLGLRHIRPIAISFAMASALPRPPEEVFDHEGFWSDSLIQAMFARAFAARCCPGEKEVAFTAALLADLAIPVLLLTWQRSYAPVISKWRSSTHRLSDIEKQIYGWNHAEAGAHILDAWGLPAELTRCIEMHARPLEEIHRDEERGGVMTPVAVATLAPSVQRRDPVRTEGFVRTAMREFALSPAEMVVQISQIRSGFEEVYDLFDIREKRAFATLDALVAAASLQE